MIEPENTNLLGWIISAFFSSLWLTAAWHKLQDLSLFRRHLLAYDLLPSAVVGMAAYALPLAEMLLAFWLLAPNSLGYWMSTALMLIYAAAMAIHLFAGRQHLDCGCGGAAYRISWGLVSRNMVMAGASTLPALVGKKSMNTEHFCIAIGSGFVLWLLYALMEKILALFSQPRLLPTEPQR